MRYPLRLAILSGLALLLTHSAIAKPAPGPDAAEVEAFLASKPEALRPLYRTAYMQGAWNGVLNLQRLGLRAMELQLWEDAARAFDMALDHIEAIYGKSGDKGAARARSTFRKEANKDFVGEPYERAMTYYYRGLLYLREGDYENARAVFSAGEMQDAEADGEDKRSDFAALNYLIGWSSHCLGQADKAQEAFVIAQKAAPGLEPPLVQDNILLIGETGIGPVKSRAGSYQEKLVFLPAQVPQQTIFFRFGQKIYQPVEAADIYYQASTRGTRQIDVILDGKASFKSTTAAVGQVGMMAGLQMMNDEEDNSGTGVAVAATGALFALLSGISKPEADARMWDGLPGQILMQSVQLKNPLVPQVEVHSAPNMISPPATLMIATPKACALIWARANPTPYGADPAQSNAPGVEEKLLLARLRNKKMHSTDNQFRAMLRGE